MVRRPCIALFARAAPQPRRRLDPADCAQWLSLQVHPTDELAVKLEGPEQFGKTEAWHILDAKPDAKLIAGLQRIPGVTIAGITDSARFNERVPTVVFVKEGHTPQDIAAYLAAQNIYVWHGNYYAVEIMNTLGRAEHGMVRVGLAHYNTPDEVERLLAAVRALA